MCWIQFLYLNDGVLCRHFVNTANKNIVWVFNSKNTLTFHQIILPLLRFSLVEPFPTHPMTPEIHDHLLTFSHICKHSIGLFITVNSLYLIIYGNGFSNSRLNATLCKGNEVRLSPNK